MTQTTLSYSTVASIVVKIADEINSSNWKPTLIVGVVRGGLVPSTILSHKLGLPMITTHVSLRDCFSLIDHDVEQLITAACSNHHRILIVEDINDSGATLDKIQLLVTTANPNISWGKDIRTAVVVENKSSQYACNYTGLTVDKSVRDVWINFPWEHN